MGASLNQINAAALQAYVQDFKRELVRKLFFGFPTASVVGLELGVKGRRVLPQIIIGNLAKRYRKTFNPRTNGVTHDQRVLENFLIDVDLEIQPTDYQGSYLGKHMKAGQDPLDWPFAAEIMDGVISKLASEMEVALWQAEVNGVAADADMIDVFNGFHKIITDEITATNLVPIATGAITNTNAVASLRALYKDLGPQYQMGNMDCFISPADEIHYLEDYQTRYGATAQAFNGGNSLHLDIGQINVYKLPGIKPGALLMTPKENLVYGPDGFDDYMLFNFKDLIKGLIQMSSQFRIGCQIGIIDNDLISVNDQH